MGTKKFNIRDFDSIESLGKFIYEKGELHDEIKCKEDDPIKFNEVHILNLKINQCTLETAIKNMRDIRKWMYQYSDRDPVSIDFNHVYVAYTFDDLYDIKSYKQINPNVKLFSLEIFAYYYEDKKSLNLSLGLTTCTDNQFIDMLNIHRAVIKTLRRHLDHLSSGIQQLYGCRYI